MSRSIEIFQAPADCAAFASRNRRLIRAFPKAARIIFFNRQSTRLGAALDLCPKRDGLGKPVVAE